MIVSRLFKKTFIVGILLLIMPFSAYATSDAVVAGIPGAGPIGKNTCEPGWSCQYYTGVLRFTYVDQSGKAISNSFDFISYKNQTDSLKFYYNALTGDKSKLTGGFEFATASYANFPMLSTFIGKYNYYIDQLASRSENPLKGVKSTLPTSGSTGGWLDNAYSGERAWFRSLTENGLTEEQYQANVEAFGLALQDMYSDFNAEAMKLKIQEGCMNGEEIYIQMEPVYMVYSYGKAPVLGNIRDILTFYQQNSYTSSEISSMITYLNSRKKNYLWTIYYDRNINSANFTGYSPVQPGEYSLSSVSSINDKVGYAVGLDWINDSRNGCTRCVYKDEDMYYNDEIVSTYKPPFNSIEEYTLSTIDEGGLNCCPQLEEVIKKGETLSTRWQEAYNEYCIEKVHEECSIEEDKKTGETKYYCLGGVECTKDQFDIDCPEDCDEPDVPDPGNNCCTDDPIEPGWIGGTVNNCCEDGGTSEAYEYYLDELFCNNDYLGVDNYQYKCGSDFYVQNDTDLDEDYCNMYCTERVSVEIPGSIAATSGRYFELTTTSKGTKSSYIEGFKRCRIRIQYDKWEQDYYDTVQAQADAYNSFQKNKAKELMYEEAIKAKQPNQKETSTIICSCEYKYDTTCGTGKNAHPCTKTATHTDPNYYCDIEYTKYPFNKMFDIYNIKIDEDKRDDCKNIYEAIEFKKDGKDKTSHSPWSAWEIDPSIAKCNAETKGHERYVNVGYGCTTTCKRTTTTAENNREDVYTEEKKYENNAKNDNVAFNTAADQAKELEKTIDVCDDYFTNDEYKGSDGKANYNFNAQQQFSYTQVYMDNYGKLQLDEIFINFEETPGCVIDDKPVTGADAEDKLSDDKYSKNKYGDGAEKMTDFKNSTLEHQKTAEGFKTYLDDSYDADKIFTTDAKYHATCSWDEGENTLYTLVPSGSASESTSEMNYTEHNQEYKIYLTTLEGTYETYWDISGLGSPREGSTEGRFDQYFKDAGDTCSNSDPNETAMLSCKIRSEHEVVLTGYCNGSNGSDTTTDPDDCDPYAEGFRLFNFKVVDAANLFPSGYNTVDGTVAANWTNTIEGKSAMQEIQSTAASGSTFAPENLTYSFVLSPTDMGHIKNYNDEQLTSGGYSDFTLICNSKSCEDGACNQCKSPFLENLASGTVEYNGSSHSVTGWNNKNKDLTAVRKGYDWN